MKFRFRFGAEVLDVVGVKLGLLKYFIKDLED